ncbi:MAG: hypothetical protein ACI363_08800 [Phocaeicola plebeius]
MFKVIVESLFVYPQDKGKKKSLNWNRLAIYFFVLPQGLMAGGGGTRGKSVKMLSKDDNNVKYKMMNGE